MRIWFIIVFSFLLEPFQCQEHPNGILTLKHMYQSVYCNGRAEHLQMYIIGAFACLMPITFLVFCRFDSRARAASFDVLRPISARKSMFPSSFRAEWGRETPKSTS